MIALGDSASVTRRIDRDALARAARLADAPVPAGVPLPMIYAMYSHLLGEVLPGRGTNYLKQSGELVRAVAAGTRLTATVTVTRLRPDKQLVDLRTLCRDEAGRVCCDGRALVLAAHAFDPAHHA